MPGKIHKTMRGVAIACAVAMFVVAGHRWNLDKVHTPILYIFDFMILLLTIFIVAVLMDDATEARKNVNAGLLLGAGVLGLFFVFS